MGLFLKSLFLYLFFFLEGFSTVFCTRVKSGVRSWVSPYQIAGPRVDDEAKPAARPTTEFEFPSLFLWSSLQFTDPVVGSLALIPYSSALPAFIWLTGTSRTPLMKSWYCAFNLGFIAFGFVLKFALLIGIFPILAVIFADLAAAVGFYGFLQPDRFFIFCGILWASFILPKLIYTICLAQEKALSLGGLWQHWLLLLLSTLLFFFVFSWAQRRHRRLIQNGITAITNAFGAVASLSFCWTFFAGGKKNEFDFLAFLSLPSHFKWNDPSDVFFFFLFLFLLCLGLAIDFRRDLQQESPGFGEGKDEPPLFRGEAAGVEFGLQRPAAAAAAPPASAASSSDISGPFLIFPDTQQKTAGVVRGSLQEQEQEQQQQPLLLLQQQQQQMFIDSDLEGANSEEDNDEQDEAFLTKWIHQRQLQLQLQQGAGGRLSTAASEEFEEAASSAPTPRLSKEEEEELQIHLNLIRQAARV